MVGYYYKRYAERIHDKLYTKVIFMDDGMTKAAVISCDICYFEKKNIMAIRDKIEELNICHLRI